MIFGLKSIILINDFHKLVDTKLRVDAYIFHLNLYENGSKDHESINNNPYV